MKQSTPTLWQRFCRSGSVQDYLEYKQKQRDSEDAECNKPYLPS